MTFDKDDATRRLHNLAQEYNAEVSAGGGGLHNACAYDSYFRVGTDKFSVAFSIRKPKSERSAYVGITRLANGRRIVEDQIPLEEWPLATSYFRAAVELARAKEVVRTVGLVDRSDELWLDTPPRLRD